MLKVYLDLETIPGGEYPSLDSIKADGRLKNPDLIEEDKKTKAEEIFRKRALDEMEGEIICLAYRFSDEDKASIITGSTEDIVQTFYNVLFNKVGCHDKIYSISYVGFNTMFDIKFIRMAALKYCLPLFRILPHVKNDKRIHNIQDIFTMKEFGKYIALWKVCKFLGIDHKNAIDGSKIYDYYLDGRLNEIYEYCKKDVDVLVTIENMCGISLDNTDKEYES